MRRTLPSLLLTALSAALSVAILGALTTGGPDAMAPLASQATVATQIDPANKLHAIQVESPAPADTTEVEEKPAPPKSESPAATLELPEKLRKVFLREPTSVDELKAMQRHVQQLVPRVTPTVVAVQYRGGMGSGVIISEDGYVLTAGHVFGRPDRNVTLIMHDGRRIRGKSLGANHRIDSGLVKITTPGKWPYADIGKSSGVRRGQWCMALGHPGGYTGGRKPPLRVGRVLIKETGTIVTDCTLVGGDSGGPLFDMEGKIIGIHSRIGDGLSANLHVPVDTYRKTWDRLARGDLWGGSWPGGPIIGVVSDGSDTAKVGRIVNGSPAAAAGIKVGDVITSFNGKKVETFEQLSESVIQTDPGDRVKVELTRDDEEIELDLVIGRLDEG